MDLISILLQHHSKAHTFKVVELIENDESSCEALIQIVLADHEIAAARAAWVMNEVVRKVPSKFLPYQKPIVALLSRPEIHASVLRNILCIWERTPVPEEFQGVMVERCISFIENPTLGSGIKSYAIAILEPICIQYPELGIEVERLLKARFEFEKPAFKSRATHFFKRMNKLTRS